MKPGRAGTMTHDYKRNGTIDLFAAMNVATGEVLTGLNKGHTGADILRFFKQIDATVPRGLGVHVVLDNLSAHPPPRSRSGWLTATDVAGTFTHTDLEFVAQPDRTMVQRTHRPAPAPRYVTNVQELSDAISTWASTGTRPQALHLESHRRRHHHQSPRGRETLRQTIHRRTTRRRARRSPVGRPVDQSRTLDRERGSVRSRTVAPP